MKIRIYDIGISLALMKKLNCSNYDENNRIFQQTLKSANNLVEGIQNSIRKKNLNVNFLILQ